MMPPRISQLRYKVDIVGAGFINFHLQPAAKLAIVHEVLAQGDAFSRSTLGSKQKIQIEFVSANRRFSWSTASRS